MTSSSTQYEFDESERQLVRMIDCYGDAVQRSAEELMPHYICTYLYDLTQEFNRFYEANRIIGDEREAQRLVLLDAYTKVLKNGTFVTRYRSA